MANPFKIERPASEPQALALTGVSNISSPWADSSGMATFLMSEALGVELASLKLGRSQAIQLAAVARGRHLIVAALSGLPLTALNTDGPVTTQPSFLYRSDTDVSPQERIARTLDSLVFYGEALWAVQRGAKQEGQAYAPILDAAWVPHDRWTVDGSRILVDGKPVDDTQIIYFNGYTDGLLNTAALTIKGALAIEASWVSRARNPIPMTVIRHPEGSQRGELTPDEIATTRANWAKARQDDDGAVGYLPPGLMIDTHGEVSADMFEGARNANRVDIASHLGIPASLLDGSVAEASLTYVTTEGNANRFVTETLPLYLGPIENALSADNVVPRGQRVRFDRTELLSGFTTPTSAPEED